jgi:hypothetical protein
MKYLLLCIVSVFILGFVSSTAKKKPKKLTKSINKEYNIEVHQLVKILALDSMVNESFDGEFFKITSNDTLLGYTYLGRVVACRIGGCDAGVVASPFALQEEEGGDTEYFDYFILYGLDAKVSQIKIYNYQATHGQEVCSRGWLNQFIGFDTTEELEVGKNIDGISGATISVYALVSNLEYITSILKQSI